MGSGIGPNDCFVTDNVMSSARNLVDGFPLTPIAFADVCELIEMAVLHERIIMTLPTFTDSPLEAMLDAEVVTSTMFANVTPPTEEDKQFVSDIYRKCLETLEHGAIFGRGIIDKGESGEEQLSRAVTRIQVGELLLSVDYGRREVAPEAEAGVARLRGMYRVFQDYADAVFNAAQHFQVHAYVGTSEIAYAVQRTARSVPFRLYDELRKLYQDRVDRFLAASGYATYDIPPFALIVLSRAKRREDIIPETLRARDEFRAFRETCTAFAVRLRDAAQGGAADDIIRLQNDLDRAIQVLTQKVKASDNDSRFTYRLWDIVKAASPSGIAKNILDQLKTYDIERRHLQTVNGLMDVWKKLRQASTYEAVLRSPLFGKEFSPAEFAAFREYLGRVREYLPVGQSF
jgi:hypothetical protein